MKRRSFITLASIAPLGVAYSGEVEDKQELLKSAWRESTESASSGVFYSDDNGYQSSPKLRLEVSLIDKDDPVIEKVIKTEEGEYSLFTFKGLQLPRGLYPEDGIIKSFRFFWGDHEIPVEKRFWNDFGGCHIEKTSLVKEKIPDEHQYEFGEFLNGLRGPRVVLSADKGTALVEWVITDTDACCGHTATVRWMIGKSGMVMRHRHTTPNPC